jgi:hypothetical protein
VLGARAPISAGSLDYVVLQAPGFAGTIPYAVNERGEVAGGALTCSGEFHGFLYRDGAYSSIDVPGAITTIPTAINERGVVVGYFYTADFQLRTFTFWRGQYETISVPGFNLVPQGSDSQGDIVGWVPSNPYQAFLLTKSGEFTIFSAPGDIISLQAWGINSSGAIVGTGYSPSSGGAVSFVYRGGEFAISPGQLTYGINDRGDLLVESGGSTGIYHNGVRLDLDHPEAQYTLLDLSNNWVGGALPATNVNGCYETLGFMLRIP